MENSFGLLLLFQTSEVKASRVSRTLRLRILACWTYPQPPAENASVGSLYELGKRGSFAQAKERRDTSPMVGKSHSKGVSLISILEIVLISNLIRGFGVIS